MPDVRERLEGSVVRAALALPRPLKQLLAGRSVEIDGQTLDPEIQLALKLERLAAGPSFETLPVPEARAQIDRDARVFRGPTIGIGRIEEIEVAGPSGPLPARLYSPTEGAEDLPLLVYLHGGGWVVGDLETHDSFCRLLAREAGILVLSVVFRQAPEHPFPAAVDDSLASFSWAVENAERLGSRPEAVALGGDSAGGNLTAVVSQLAAAGGGPVPALQLLVFPVTDLSRKRRSYELFSDGFFLTERQMDWYRDHYLTDPAQALDPRASPILAKDLSGLPPAHFVLSGFDVLRDEGLDYAQRLREAGVPVTMQLHRGMIHSFINAVGVSRLAREAVRDLAVTLRRMLAQL